MSIKVRQLRPSAVFNSDTDVLLFGASAVTPLSAFSRTIPLGQQPKTEIELRPGVMYRLHTGLAIDGLRHPLEFRVQPSEKAAVAYGLQVWRTSIHDGELVVLCTVQAAYQLKVLDQLFEGAWLSEFTQVPEAPAAPVVAPIKKIEVNVAPAPSAGTKKTELSDAEKQRLFMESGDDVQAVTSTVLTDGKAPGDLSTLKGSVKSFT